MRDEHSRAAWARQSSLGAQSVRRGLASVCHVVTSYRAYAYGVVDWQQCKTWMSDCYVDARISEAAVAKILMVIMVGYMAQRGSPVTLEAPHIQHREDETQQLIAQATTIIAQKTHENHQPGQWAVGLVEEQEECDMASKQGTSGAQSHSRPPTVLLASSMTHTCCNPGGSLPPLEGFVMKDIFGRQCIHLCVGDAPVCRRKKAAAHAAVMRPVALGSVQALCEANFGGQSCAQVAGDHVSSHSRSCMS